MGIELYAEVVQVIKSDNNIVYCYFDTGHIKAFNVGKAPKELIENENTIYTVECGTLTLKLNNSVYDFSPDLIFLNGVDTTEESIKEIQDKLDN